VLAAGLLKVTQKGKLLNAVSPGECVGEMVYARRSLAPRSATVTAVEVAGCWACASRHRFLLRSLPRALSEAFLSVMAERWPLLGGRLVSLMQEQKVGLV
jgi:CRP-like cAMP-binding protein